MVIDTSAMIAILLREPEASSYEELLAKSSLLRMSAASYVEAGIIMDRRGNSVSRALFESYIEGWSIQVEPVSVEQAMLARQAYDVFGKGRHAAGLNYADCFSYALAKSLREPLLFKGNDFSKTDLVSAIG